MKMKTKKHFEIHTKVKLKSSWPIAAQRGHKASIYQHVSSCLHIGHCFFYHYHVRRLVENKLSRCVT